MSILCWEVASIMTYFFLSDNFHVHQWWWLKLQFVAKTKCFLQKKTINNNRKMCKSEIKSQWKSLIWYNNVHCGVVFIIIRVYPILSWQRLIPLLPNLHHTTPVPFIDNLLRVIRASVNSLYGTKKVFSNVQFSRSYNIHYKKKIINRKQEESKAKRWCGRITVNVKSHVYSGRCKIHLSYYIIYSLEICYCATFNLSQSQWAMLNSYKERFMDVNLLFVSCQCFFFYLKQ